MSYALMIWHWLRLWYTSTSVNLQRNLFSSATTSQSPARAACTHILEALNSTTVDARWDMTVCPGWTIRATFSLVLVCSKAAQKSISRATGLEVESSVFSCVVFLGIETSIRK